MDPAGSLAQNRDTPDPRRWFALVAIAAAQFMVVLDIAVVNVALPSIGEELGFSQENLQWVVSAYAIVFGGFLLLGGRLADLWGRRRVFMAGVTRGPTAR
jgi:MFS family permease